MEPMTLGSSSVTWWHMLERHFRESLWGRQDVWTRKPGDMMHFCRPDGIHYVEWLQAKIRDVVKNGVERGLVEVLGKHEPCPYRALGLRAGPWDK